MHGYRRYFTDTVTIYHKTVDPVTKDDVFQRVVVPKVMARWHTERTVDSSGVVKVAQSLSVTVLPDTDPGELMQPGDYLLVGDGESDEGQVWEAAMFAGNQQLDNLCVIVDHNGLQIDGPVEEVNDPMPLADKFRAFKFHVVELADGNDFDQIRAAFAEARATKGQPTAIIAETMKGKGVSFMENNAGRHGKAPNDEQYAQAKAEVEAKLAELEGK